MELLTRGRLCRPAAERAQAAYRGAGESATVAGKRETAMADAPGVLLICLHRDEAGQGLVEYVLIIALVPFAATAGMSSLESAINAAFTKVGSILGQYIS